MKQIQATTPTPQDWIDLVRENERLVKVNRSLYSSALTIAATLHRVRSELEYDCSDAVLDRINESIRLQAIALAEHAKKTIGEQNK